jgi:hypothetical protein
MREGELPDELFAVLKTRVVGLDIDSLHAAIKQGERGEGTLTLAGLREDVRSLNNTIRLRDFEGAHFETIKAEDTVVKSFRGCTATTSCDVDGVVHENSNLPD